ncbi:ABC transporter ATP-binding protein [Helicobacter sp. MIT 21-1697]|uniref:ABC transporter ATP-binding protein n=1 Tax=Helicobacter sp. MIT 21-1697 TaxID=2993733 RepID=UPI00224B0280|nr:ABC transporter ATP-binding protein [Helicobacter sp. MIT 21-1697]MCX2717026.1 ABC transporter ATP-binding protein [Helicobacter sp. MIT 21-1697]
MNETNLVEISHLSKTYKDTIALYDINLHIPQGKIIGLLGPNGSGKSTLIKILVGLLRQYQGEVLICRHKPSLYTKEITAYLPDRNILNPRMNALQCIKYFSDFFADFDESKAKQMCENLRISLESHLKSLSKGTIEKLHLILALAREAKLYILDEPIAGVDPYSREKVFELIKKYVPKHSSVILATHLVNDVQPILDDVIFLYEGRVLHYESVQSLVSAYENLQAAFKAEVGRLDSMADSINGEWK